MVVAQLALRLILPPEIRRSNTVTDKMYDVILLIYDLGLCLGLLFPKSTLVYLKIYCEYSVVMCNKLNCSNAE